MSSERDRRLHPLTLAFLLASRLKGLLIPIVVVVFASRSADRVMVMVPLIVGVIVVVPAMLEYFSYTYRYEEEDLVIRTGFFFRNERHIPYNRIQSIDAVQNVAQRHFKVAVVRVHTGATAEPEATMSVLPLSALAEMRERVHLERRVAVEADAGRAAPDSPIAAPVPPTTVLRLSPRDLIMAGFIENRGMALIAAAIGVLWQIDPLERIFANWIVEAAPGLARGAEAGLTARGGGILLGASTLVLVGLLFVRILSTVWALIRLHEFTLVRDGKDLRVEYGLFTRVTATIPLRRVHTISIHQRLLHRLFDRAAIRVTTAGGTLLADESAVDREWVAPIVPLDRVEALLREVDPSLALGGAEWMPPHPGAAGRMARKFLIVSAPVAAATAFVVGWWSLLIGAALGAHAVARARGTARNIGYAIVGGRIAFRGGWLHRVTTVARFERLQSVSFEQTFFDRRANMARVAVDTAGMGGSDLGASYLPAATAAQLQARLADAAARTPFTW